MRKCLPVLILMAATSKPAQAQGFEGVVTMKFFQQDAAGRTAENAMIIAIRGTRSAITTVMANLPLRILTDATRPTGTVFMPLPPGQTVPPEIAKGRVVKGMKFDFSTHAVGLPAGAKLRKLTTVETIAGQKCEDYELTSPGTSTLRICLAHGLGRFQFPAFGKATAPDWAVAFGEREGFPLKVWSIDGKRTMEVVSVVRKKLPDDAFVVPANYIDVPAPPVAGPGH